MHRILRKILHLPTVRARELAASPQGPAYQEALRQLFDLTTALIPEPDADRAPKFPLTGPAR